MRHIIEYGSERAMFVVWPAWTKFEPLLGFLWYKPVIRQSLPLETPETLQVSQPAF